MVWLAEKIFGDGGLRKIIDRKEPDHIPLPQCGTTRTQLTYRTRKGPKEGEEHPAHW